MSKVVSASLKTYGSINASALSTLSNRAKQQVVGQRPAFAVSFSPSPTAAIEVDPFSSYECKICGQFMGSCDLCKKGEVRFISEFNLAEVFLAKR